MLYSFVLAVRESSLATTYSIFMCAPLLVAAISVPLLGEQVARMQWIAISVGMGGVLLMLRPGGNELLSFGALAALVAVVTYCFAVITLRLLARTDTTESMVFWFTAMLALGAGLLSIPVWRALQWQHLAAHGRRRHHGCAGPELHHAGVPSRARVGGRAVRIHGAGVGCVARPGDLARAARRHHAGRAVRS